jgi:hypothetical protein
VRFEVLTAEALVRTEISEELNVRRLLVTANVVRGLQILVSLMIGARGSSETSVLTGTTRRNIPENDIPKKYKIKIILVIKNLRYTGEETYRPVHSIYWKLIKMGGPLHVRTALTPINIHQFWLDRRMDGLQNPCE